jgi:hypothetical protein
MQAIRTKYLPATYFRCSRIKAVCKRGSITIPYPHEMSGDEVHRQAVRALVAKFLLEDEKEYSIPASENSWGRAFVSGMLSDGTMAHVFVS